MDRASCATYGGHVLVLPAGDRTIIDDAHHHDDAARRRAPLPRRGGLSCSTSCSIRWRYGFMQRGLVAAILVGIVCAVMGPSSSCGPRLHRRRCQPRRVPWSGHRVPARVPLYIGGAWRRSATALAIGWVARRGGLDSTPPWACCSPARSRSASCCSARSRPTSPTCSATCWATSSGSVLGHRPDRRPRRGRPADRVALLRKELLYASFDPAGRPRRAPVVASTTCCSAWSA